MLCSLPKWEGLYTGHAADMSRSRPPWEGSMPRFLGRKTMSVWWDIIALVVLVVVVVVVLALTGVIHVFGS